MKTLLTAICVSVLALSSCASTQWKKGKTSPNFDISVQQHFGRSSISICDDMRGYYYNTPKRNFGRYKNSRSHTSRNNNFGDTGRRSYNITISRRRINDNVSGYLSHNKRRNQQPDYRDLQRCYNSFGGRY